MRFPFFEAPPRGKASPPEDPPARWEQQRQLSLAWSMPVILFVWILAGYHIGRKAGSPLAGIVTGWLIGMVAATYDLWRPGRKPPPAGRK